MRVDSSRLLSRILCASGLLICIGILLALLLVVLDLRSFEVPYLGALLGWQGISIGILSVVVLLWLAFKLANGLRFPHRLRASRVEFGLAVAAGVFYLWIAQWLLMEKPLTVRLQDRMLSPVNSLDDAEKVLGAENAEERGLIAESLGVKGGRSLPVQIMAARIIANRPETYSYRDISDAIRSASSAADVNPVPLFYWLYQTSFYGEAVSGPLPFTGQMTAETFRDLVQVHLPWWFIENPLRIYLIEDDLLENVFGRAMGWKLRYALQKATLDVSSDPFGSNTFSDVFYVMHRYPQYFQHELSDMSDPLNRGMSSSYERISSGLQFDGCSVSSTDEDIEQYRGDFITFARAAYLKMLFDLDFAAKVQALVLKDSMELFGDSVADDIWAAIPEEQQLGIVVMSRDVFTPNVGKPFSIPYTLPELNCEPRSYLAQEIGAAGDELLRDDRYWRPSNPDYLWAGPGYILRIFSEVWQATYDRPIVNVPPTTTLREAIPVVVRTSR